MQKIEQYFDMKKRINRNKFPVAVLSHYEPKTPIQGLQKYQISNKYNFTHVCDISPFSPEKRT